MNEDGNDIYSRSFEVEESAMRDKNTQQSVSSMWEYNNVNDNNVKRGV